MFDIYRNCKNSCLYHKYVTVGFVFAFQQEVFANGRQRSSSLPRRRSKRLDTLRPLCENITSRTYRFDTNKGVKLLVYEYMAESKFTFDVPIKLL